MSEVKNQLGGLNYTESDDQRKAKTADLITLPPSIEGTNCGNCMFLNQATGFCRHSAVLLTVNKRMCCKFWKNPGQMNSWK